MKAFLDTHSAIFLWEGRIELFGSASRDLMERSTLFLSPLVRLELGLLREVGKLKVEPDAIVGSLTADCGVTMRSDPVEALIPFAMPLAWTRDPFDRLLVATALLHQAPLVTRDARIHQHFGGAVW
ncbi:MAG TPA: PIN domain-containing protein [Thermoanaerobaculia bacterium]|nr:PIN domain-containing protein [Thermoanaerobaculia bacterium]